MKNFCLIAVVFLTQLTANGQTDVPCKTNKILLDCKQPSVYISFEKAEHRAPLKNGESDQGVWLRLHNNSAWNVTVATLGLPDNSYGDFRVFYEVKPTRNYAGSINVSDISNVYNYRHISSVRTLTPGRTILFSVPKEHLSPGLYLSIEFSYAWEQAGSSGGGIGNISHYASFFSSDLPKQK